MTDRYKKDVSVDMTDRYNPAAPQPQREPLLDIRHRPNGDVVIKRYPFETVFHEDEWKELSEYCSSRPHTNSHDNLYEVGDVVDIINKYEGSLSDGYDYYGGQEDVLKMAQEIIITINKTAMLKAYNKFFDEMRNEDFDNLGYIDMDSIEVIYIRLCKGEK